MEAEVTPSLRPRVRDLDVDGDRDPVSRSGAPRLHAGGGVLPTGTPPVRAPRSTTATTASASLTQPKRSPERLERHQAASRALPPAPTGGSPRSSLDRDPHGADGLLLGGRSPRAQ